MKTHANRLLDAARSSTPDQSHGVSKGGAAIISYCRVSGLQHRRYDVGTAAMSFKIGYRAEVVPYVEAILAGCMTLEAAEQWIADRPNRIAVARETGARLPPGAVCAVA